MNVKTEEELRIRDRYHRYFDLLEGGVCIVLADGTERVAFASNPTAVLYECGDEEEFLNLISSSFRNMMVPEDYKPLAGIAKDHPEHFYFSFHYQTKENHFRKTECAGSLKNTSFGMAYVIQIFSSEQISSDRTADGKTGLPGMHQFFGEALFRMKEQMRLHQASSFCPVSFDVTNFKEYNRLYGMSQGDQCLEKIAETITGCFPGSLAGHLTADHFVALLPEKNLREKLEYVCNEVNRFIGDDGIRIKAGVYPASEKDSIDDLRHSFDMAKIACDTIKQDGNRSVVFYHPAMGKIIANRTYILRHFAEALEKHYIRVYYQPVIRTMTGCVSGFEALARWEDPALGMIMPGVFIPVLEDAQLINRLDRYVLERVLGSIRDRMDNGMSLLPVSMNLSAYDFEVANPLDTIDKMVRKYQVPRNLLCFEITERVMLRNHFSMVTTIRQFQDAGYQIWMDDFGNEYSSLNSLHNYHFDVIKIDMGFFSHFDDRSRKIIESVVTMAKKLGVQTLAEGVETQEQLTFLRKIGCGRIQGYYYGCPMMYEDVLAFVRGRNLRWEDPDEAHMIGAAEEINIASDSPVAIFSFDGSNIMLLVENDAYQRELRSTGTQSLSEANANLADADYPLSARFRQFLKKVQKTRAEETLMYVDNGQYIRLAARWIAGEKVHWVGVARILNISSNAEQQFVQNLDNILRNLYQLYTGFYLIDWGKEEVRILRSCHEQFDAEEIVRPIRSFAGSFAGSMVYPDDRERFRRLFTPVHVGREAYAKKVTSREEVVRIRQTDGTYRWTVFESLVLFKSPSKNILLCEREDIWEKKSDRDVVLPVFCRSFGVTGCSAGPSDATGESELFRALCDASPYPFFWKSREGELLGASSAWKRTSELRGRTVPDPAENMVLHEGAQLAERDERIVIGGKLQDIHMTWAPWYLEKEIAGTLGMMSIERPDGNEETRLGLDDPATGLLSFRGAIEAGLFYADQFRLKKSDYIAVLIDIPAYSDVARKYPGRETGILREISDSLRKMLSSGWAVGRIGLCSFLCFRSRKNAGDFEEELESLSDRLPLFWQNQNIQTVPVLARAVAYGSEAESLDDLLQLLMRRMNNAEKQIYGDRPYTGDRVVIRKEALDTLPERVVISDPKTYELIYLNEAVRKDLGIDGEAPLTGKLCYKELEGFDAPCGNCPNLLLRRDRTYSETHVCHRTGNKLLLRSVLIPWAERTLKLTIATDPGEYFSTMAKDHELIYQEMRANEAISIGMSEEDPDRGIDRVIECISGNLKPERFLIFEEQNDNTVNATYEWTAPGVLSLKTELQCIPKTELRVLYSMFTTQHVVLVGDMAEFQDRHPDFNLRIRGVRSFVSGQLNLHGRIEGFTMVINPTQDTFRIASLLLSTLTDFITIMIRNRNSLHRLEEQSMTDQLTGAGNRRALERKLRDRSCDGVLGVISIDLNGLKNINDTAGHHAGDILLCETVRILRECAGADCVFRTGGDEFVVVTNDMEEGDIRLMIRHMRESAKINGINMAIGFVCSRETGADFDALLTKADFNMYKDKGQSYRRGWHDHE